MREVSIEQALLFDRQGIQPGPRSPGFRDDWEPEARRLCLAFGERPPGVTCPASLFAYPLDKQHIAVVQVADQPANARLGFHLLVVPRAAYVSLGGDPFAIADSCVPPWQAQGSLPALRLPVQAPARRTVEQVQEILKKGDQAPHLLGGAQALVDGGRLAVERLVPDPEFVRGLWALLPFSVRSHLWPASFAFANRLGFHVVVAPQPRGVEYSGYLNEEQAAEYPEGRYELNLQIAVEAGDQAELDRLFARRSRGETWRFAALLLGFIFVILLVMKAVSPVNPEKTGTPPITSPRPAVGSKEHRD